MALILYPTRSGLFFRGCPIGLAPILPRASFRLCLHMPTGGVGTGPTPVRSGVFGSTTAGQPFHSGKWPRQCTDEWNSGNRRLAQVVNPAAHAQRARGPFSTAQSLQLLMLTLRKAVKSTGDAMNWQANNSARYDQINDGGETNGPASMRRGGRSSRAANSL
jgi:hypothetical protein